MRCYSSLLVLDSLEKRNRRTLETVDFLDQELKVFFLVNFLGSLKCASASTSL